MATVGILGGTGPAGRGVAARLAGAGYEVVLGSRDADRAKGIARGLTLRGEGTVVGGTNEDAAGCNLVVVAT
ncbi:MAG TPA: NAD(P)-binding domain-containing protein, partial [Acidimicrobiales bacterium]|nr:NAD(P)-binding domain-containing protein [Acidimicrobiales bacterium]